MNMNNTINGLTDNLLEHKKSENNIERARPAWDKGNYRVTPQYEVALGRLRYSLKVLVFGKTVTDAKISRKNIRRG
jgi:hypothetical protein